MSSAGVVPRIIPLIEPGASCRVAAVGECMVELSLEGGADPAGRCPATVGFAGDTLNTAVYLKRSCPPAVDVAYVTAVGRDAFSDRMLEFFAAESLDASLIDRHDSRVPGLYAITTDDAGERSFTYWRERSAARTLFSAAGGVNPESLAGFDLIYLSGISMAILEADARERLIDWLPTYRAAGGRVAFDSNYRPRLWPDADAARDCIGRLWNQCDIALPSADDEMALFGEPDPAAVRDRLQACGVIEGVVKNGMGEPLVISPADRPVAAVSRLPPATRVVDTTAAGDSFNGGYLAARLAGAGVRDAILRGHACAVCVIGERGAILPRERFVSSMVVG